MYQELFSPRTKTTYSKPNSAREAARARDALATTLYARIFDEVVALVNTALVPAAGVREGGDIGLLDVFGFEVLHTPRAHALRHTAHLTCTACALRVHCMCTARAPHVRVHRIDTACAPHRHCIDTA
jgi:hypothetical protein